MNKRGRKIWKPKTYIIMNDRYHMEFETHYKHIAIDFIKDVSQFSDTHYYLFEKVKEKEIK